LKSKLVVIWHKLPVVDVLLAFVTIQSSWFCLWLWSLAASVLPSDDFYTRMMADF